MSKINLLNHNVGIDQFLATQSNEHIPTAKPMASNSVFEAGLSSHFAMGNIKANLENMLVPNVGDGEILRPDVFNRTINAMATNFSSLPQGENLGEGVKDMMNNVINPLLENKDLLNLYSNLMVAG